MTRTLTLSTGSFDQINTFEVNVGDRYPVTASLYRDYEKVGDGVYWAMNSGTMLKDQYSDADRAERARLQAETPLNNGDIVVVDGQQYRARVLGRYSDCAIFDRI